MDNKIQMDGNNLIASLFCSDCLFKGDENCAVVIAVGYSLCHGHYILRRDNHDLVVKK